MCLVRSKREGEIRRTKWRKWEKGEKFKSDRNWCLSFLRFSVCLWLPIFESNSKTFDYHATLSKLGHGYVPSLWVRCNLVGGPKRSVKIKSYVAGIGQDLQAQSQIPDHSATVFFFFLIISFSLSQALFFFLHITEKKNLLIIYLLISKRLLISFLYK